MIIDSIIKNTVFVIWNCFLLYFFCFVGLYFSVKTRFVQLRLLKNMIPLLFNGQNNRKGNSDQKGVSSFQALTVSLASRVGTGNLAGVAFALSTGGPGAIFWMWIIVIVVGGSLSFVESTLSQIYKREKKSDNGKRHFYGGSSCYIERALKTRFLGIVFAILIVVFVFILNMVQAHTIGHSIKYLFEPHLKTKALTIVSLVLPFLALWPLLGGALRIAKISGYVVPLMSIFYFFTAIIITFLNIHNIPKIISLIIKEAFNFKTSIPGGILGGIIITGLKRSIFSSEAGTGTASHASAAAEVNHPVEQGILQIFSVFFDTLIVCSITAFLILQSNIPLDGITKGIEIAQSAMQVHLGNFGPLFITIIIFFFAYSSIIGNYFYAESSFYFLNSNSLTLIFFRILMSIIIYIGTLMEFSRVWALADIIIGLLAIINLIAILFLSKIAFMTLQDYEKKLKTHKNIDFKASHIGMEKKLDVWD